MSALVWLRPSVIRKNSSAIYLGSLAINDAVYLLIGLIVSLWSWLLPQFQQPAYFILITDIASATARRLEPLLVLAFSVERLIAVCYPLHVRLYAINMLARCCSGSAFVSINEVNLRRDRLVLGWVTVSGFNSWCGTFISVCN